jgi:hypothetical protein
MANHLRQQIRERVGTLLTGLTTTGGRVYQSRVYPVAAANLPGLTLYTAEESAEIMTLGSPRRSERTLSLIVEARAKATTNLDDTLDTICKEVEIAMAADPTLNGLVNDHHLARTSIELAGEGEQPVGVATMEFTIMYDVAESTPDVVY